MHIGVVTRQFPKVSETFILDHVVGLMRRGHQVTVVADRPHDDEITLSGHDAHQLATVTVYRPTRSRDDLSRLPGLSASVASALARKPGNLRFLTAQSLDPSATRKMRLRDVLASTALAECDLVHCHFGPTGLRTIEALDTLGLDTPVVTTFHGFDLSQYVATHGPHVYDPLFARGALFLPISDTFRDRLIGLGAPPERTVVHRMGVDTERFSTVDHPAHEGPLRVLAIGRLVEKKGMANAITAVSRAADSGVDIALTVVGDGPLRHGLEHLATSRRAPVTFVGSVDRARVIALLEESDVLLAPSVTAADGDTEGIPVSIMEAMSCGLPVVATRHSGIPEVVIDGVTGLLADEHDPAALAEHLTTLAAEPDTASPARCQRP